MSFDSPEKQSSGDKKPEKTIKEKVRPRIQGDLSATFDRNEDGVQRVADFWLRLNQILEGVDVALLESIKSNLDQCAAIKDKEEFVARAFAAVEPILTPEIFPKLEKIARRDFNERGGFTPLNEILSYEVDDHGDCLHLHWAPSRTIAPEKRTELLLAGMQKLAQIVKVDENIVAVAAASWIVAKWPELLEQAGFTVDPEMSKEDKKKYFPEENSIFRTAHIDRESFLSRYLAD